MLFSERALQNACLLFLLLGTGKNRLRSVNAQTCSPGDDTCQAAPSSSDDCADHHGDCFYWANIGECFKNPGFMDKGCPYSCELCPDPTQRPKCENQHEKCEEWAKANHCTESQGYMHVSCRRSCGLCSDEYSSVQLIRGADMGVSQVAGSSTVKADAAQVMERIEKAREYLNSITPSLKSICSNQDRLCAAWATQGDCDQNPAFMKTKCAPVCGSCEQLTIDGRCPVDPTEPNAWTAGDLNAMFAKLTSEPYLSDYNVQILSSPSDDNPWVITLDNVISEEEAKTLIHLGELEGYERSSDIGTQNPDGTHGSVVSSYRTSSNAWCERDCFRSKVTHRIVGRLAAMTGIPETNSESLQLLRYEQGQHYGAHHDWIPDKVNRQPGGRLLTFFLYLNDVEEGGETSFSKLNITVTPKTGRALLWPNVLDQDPNERDLRTTHEAFPVKAGIKFAANAWFHMRDWRSAKQRDCT